MPCSGNRTLPQLKYRTANNADEARLDVVAENVGARIDNRRLLTSVNLFHAIHHLLNVINDFIAMLAMLSLTD